MAAHFNHAGASIPPASVVERVVSHLRLEADLGGYEAAEAVAYQRQQVNVELSALIGAAPTEVVSVESATRAWEMVMWSLALSHRWSDADRVVVDQFAYASSWATLLRLRSALGVEVAVAPALDDGSIDVDGLDEVVDGRTRLVLVTHVPTHVGTVSDVAAVGPRLAGHRIVYAVDASQSLGQLPIDVGLIGCQVAFAPGRKFLRAPRGTGLLYVDAPLAETLEPLSVDLTSASSLDAGGYRLHPGAGRFEGFERSVALHLGLGEAARTARAIGVDEIAHGVADRTARWSSGCWPRRRCTWWRRAMCRASCRSPTTASTPTRSAGSSGGTASASGSTCRAAARSTSTGGARRRRCGSRRTM